MGIANSSLGDGDTLNTPDTQQFDTKLQFKNKSEKKSKPKSKPKFKSKTKKFIVNIFDYAGNKIQSIKLDEDCTKYSDIAQRITLPIEPITIDTRKMEEHRYLLERTCIPIMSVKDQEGSGGGSSEKFIDPEDDIDKTVKVLNIRVGFKSSVIVSTGDPEEYNGKLFVDEMIIVRDTRLPSGPYQFGLFPKTLTKLTLKPRIVDDLRDGIFPDGLIELNLQNCFSPVIRSLPDTIKKLRIRGKQHRIDKLPSNLERLELDILNSAVLLPKKLPNTLKFLAITGEYPKCLDIFPENLETLYVYKKRSRKMIDPLILPHNLKKFICGEEFNSKIIINSNLQTLSLHRSTRYDHSLDLSLNNVLENLSLPRSYQFKFKTLPSSLKKICFHERSLQKKRIPTKVIKRGTKHEIDMKIVNDKTVFTEFDATQICFSD